MEQAGLCQIHRLARHTAVPDTQFPTRVGASLPLVVVAVFVSSRSIGEAVCTVFVLGRGQVGRDMARVRTWGSNSLPPLSNPEYMNGWTSVTVVTKAFGEDLSKGVGRR